MFLLPRAPALVRVLVTWVVAVAVQSPLRIVLPLDVLSVALLHLVRMLGGSVQLGGGAGAVAVIGRIWRLSPNGTRLILIDGSDRPGIVDGLFELAALVSRPCYSLRGHFSRCALGFFGPWAKEHPAFSVLSGQVTCWQFLHVV
ncbi:hypothetical protein BV898_19544 [Hypsibius exemplaris]|uniref:Uncharacterized protein n=1 Tax=Hypsibius exemplaris TaxID=2072580 RepID=A0A9X6NJT5_HYPEX|nr:hypothetical protein BV898_19544 [Hypsibius exemplaris]